jgi:hypothetical protein
MSQERDPVNHAFEWTALGLDICQFLVKLGVGIGFRSTVFVADALRLVSFLLVKSITINNIKAYVIAMRSSVLWSSKAMNLPSSRKRFSYGVCYHPIPAVILRYS